MVLQYLINAIINGSIISILAIGFALVYNTTRIFHIAYAALYTLSGYVFYQFYELNNYSFIVAVLISLTVTSIISLTIDMLVYRILNKKSLGLHSIMIASIALFIIILNITVLIWGNSPRLVSNELLFNFNIVGVSGNRIIILTTYLLILGALIIFIKKGKFVTIIRSIRDNQTLAGLMGINVGYYRAGIFIISGMIVGIVGSIQAFDVGINPNIGLPVFIYAFIALIIGGIGRIEGAILGGYILGFLQTIAEYFINSQWVVLSVFVVLFLFLIYLPKGLLPEKRREL